MNLKKRVGLLFLGAVLAAAPPAHALRCNHRVIQVGDTIDRVETHCGRPSDVTSWQEEITLGGTYSPGREKRPSGRFWDHYAKRVYITVERWTYNFGSTRLIRYLTFENGVLTDIETGPRGD